MGLKVTLWEQRPKTDGTCSVCIYLNRDKHAYYTIKGIACKPAEFDYTAGRIKRTRVNWQSINTTIAATYNKFEGLMIEHPKKSVKEIIELYEGKNVPDGKLIPFAEHLVEQCEKGEIKRAYNTYKKYTTVINHLKTYNPDIKFTDINKNFYDTFTGLLRNDYEHRENTIGGMIKILKVFLNEANERGICNVTEHKKKYFKTFREETDAIYLTESELKIIMDLDLYSQPTLAEERDRFIAATYLLLRWSDSIRAGKVNFFKSNKTTYFRQRHQKTNAEVIIPVKPIVKEIFERNNYCLHFTGKNEKANVRLKEIGRLAAFDKKGKATSFNDDIQANGETHKKYELITTHTARRSGATNLYLSGIDKKALMEFGGWTTENHMLKYIRVSKLETAQLMASHSFFR